MRPRFNNRFPLFQSRIEQVEISSKYRDGLPKLLRGIQYLYTNKPLLNRVMDTLDQKINVSKNHTGRKGMSLWEIFVMAQI